MRKLWPFLFALVSVVLADQPGYAAPPQPQPQPQPQVKYGGPIVYTGEKPPIIHFPPPPEKVTGSSSSSILYTGCASENGKKISSCLPDHRGKG